MRYPQHRKSPYKHRVRKHQRKNRPVHSYERGKGAKPAVIRKLVKRSNLKNNPGHNPEKFEVSIAYADSSSEKLDVSAPTYVAALSRSIEERKKTNIPVTFVLRKR